jgi:hypothetical protein
MQIHTRENHTPAWDFLFGYDDLLERVEIEDDGGAVLYFSDTGDEPFPETAFSAGSDTRLMIEDAMGLEDANSS